MTEERANVITDVIIPAFNEENAIEKVLRDIPKDIVREIIVCDNGSMDRTADKAKNAGATVVTAHRRGYGYACLAGIYHIAARPASGHPDIVAFMDADYSDYPGELPHLIAPIATGKFDLVIGSRTLGVREKGAMQLQQVFGNWLATRLIRVIYGYRFTDLGPFRAIAWDKLRDLDMVEGTFGWTVEMQVKAAKLKLRCTEVPVRYRRRIGKSKVSGTVRGTFLAGYKILWTIFKLI